MELTRGVRVSSDQVNSNNGQLKVVDIAPSKALKMLRDRHFKDSTLVKYRTSLDLET